MSAYESPRIRRLRSDLAALERLRAESSIFGFHATGRRPSSYQVAFAGRSLYRDRGKVVIRDHHEIEIKLGASYPRTMPEIRWLSPIYHPNISEIGIVCLGAYGTHWVPSLALDELCVMLWDMARFQNYDIRSPYNREAAQWAAIQTGYRFPVDPRPLRDGRAALGRVESAPREAPGGVRTPNALHRCVSGPRPRTSIVPRHRPAPTTTSVLAPDRPEAPRDEVMFIDCIATRTYRVRVRLNRRAGPST